MPTDHPLSARWSSGTSPAPVPPGPTPTWRVTETRPDGEYGRACTEWWETGDAACGPAGDGPLAKWLDVYAERFEIRRGPHISAKLSHALAVAREVLSQNGDPK
ncbi:hypothetical protein [Kitasatospora sp. NPDC098663]|uniref:hypothetical protein n=1 Tax=Kitasatospora sp. NPDC098663 TaxID=3364096 RepID=UPI0037FE680A